ncbi:MAG: hypothetical protein OXM61_07450 [Candidatus Poribacteria bacterium]|nr:hypothetical protein [Candidatus Poribacteria bacterium]
MRKLILIGIIGLMVLIVWIIYLRYDTNRFIQKLSPSSIPKQQINSMTKDAVETPATDGQENEVAGQESTQAYSQEGTPEGITQTIETKPNIEGKVDVLQPDQISKDTELSPEVVALYSEFSVLYDEYVRVSKEYIPLMKQFKKSTDRYSNIGQEIGAAAGNTKKIDALYAEYDDLVKWLEVNTPIYQRLQTEVYSFSGEMGNFLKSRGFSSRDEFDWKAYFAWRSEQ